MPAEAPSSQTLRRLMKEYEAIRADFVHHPTTSSSSSSSSSSSPLPNKGNSTNLQRRGSTSIPDLLDLRPWDTEGEDLFEWYALIRGPEGGHYENGLFELQIHIPPSYPSNPPKVSFKTRIFHPNISWTNGEICLDLLSGKSWTPAWRIQSCLTAIFALLEDPEPDSPLNVDAAAVFRTRDGVAYRGMCRMYTSLYATSGM